MPDMDEVKGKAREGMGSVQQKAGEMTGNRDMEAKGEANKTEGKAQGMVGKAKDAVGDAAKSVEDKVRGH